MKSVLLCLGLGLFVSCSTAPTTPYLLDGRLSEENTAAFVKWAKKNKNGTLRIRSGGGDAAAAISASEAVLANAISVHAFDYCLSGCVQNILVASPKATVEPNTLLGWHWSANSIYNDYSYIWPNSNFRDHLRSLADREYEVFRSSPVNIGILYLARQSADLKCMTKLDGPPYLSANYRFWFTVFSHKQLELAGFSPDQARHSLTDPAKVRDFFSKNLPRLGWFLQNEGVSVPLPDKQEIVLGTGACLTSSVE